MHRFLAVSLLALVLGSTACDTAEDPAVELLSAETFEEGVAKDSDEGAFRVVLSSDEGLTVGENTLVVRLGFHDLHDPAAPGRGIPGADVILDAWMPHDDLEVSGLRGVYVGDGSYEITWDIPAPGVWQLDFDLAVGDGVQDSVSFAFVVGDE